MKKTTPARIVVTRTAAINELLQEVWMLSPELKEKISLTVHQAIVALVRERRRYKAFASEPLNLLPTNMIEALIEKVVQGGEVSEIERVTEESSDALQTLNEPHPDSIWND